MIYLVLTILLIIGIAYAFNSRSSKPTQPILAADEEDYAAFRDSVTTQPPPPPIPDPAPAPAPTQQSENSDPMASFSIAYAIVRRHEGGYQDNPNDSGNYNSRGQNVGTNWGINAQIYEHHLGRPPSKDDMINMSRDVAKAIYKRVYWDRIQGDNIINQQIANILFDGHVNHGSWGIKMMQQALGVVRDGVVGPITLTAINRAVPQVLFNTYKAIRRAGYIDLVRRRPKDQVFLNGWLRRIDSFNFNGAATVGLATITIIGLIAIGLHRYV